MPRYKFGTTIASKSAHRVVIKSNGVEVRQIEILGIFRCQFILINVTTKDLCPEALNFSVSLMITYVWHEGQLDGGLACLVASCGCCKAHCDSSEL